MIVSRGETSALEVDAVEAFTATRFEHACVYVRGEAVNYRARH
jgi:hypothetical protein